MSKANKADIMRDHAKNEVVVVDKSGKEIFRRPYNQQFISIAHDIYYEKRTWYAAQAKYDKEKTRRYVVKVMQTTEQDIIKKLDSVPNKSGYIKSLIRADIKKGDETNDRKR